MSKKEQYRQFLAKFIDNCQSGQQTCSFQEFCRQHNVDRSCVRKVLKEEYPILCTIPGYKRMHSKTNASLPLETRTKIAAQSWTAIIFNRHLLPRTAVPRLRPQRPLFFYETGPQ